MEKLIIKHGGKILNTFLFVVVFLTYILGGIKELMLISFCVVFIKQIISSYSFEMYLAAFNRLALKVDFTSDKAFVDYQKKHIFR